MLSMEKRGKKMSELFKRPLMELKDFEDMAEALEKGQGPVQVSGWTRKRFIL